MALTSPTCAVLATGAWARMAQEQLGTDATIYNKLAYNSRGQLAAIKASTAATIARGTFIPTMNKNSKLQPPGISNTITTL